MLIFHYLVRDLVEVFRELSSDSEKKIWKTFCISVLKLSSFIFKLLFLEKITKAINKSVDLQVSEKWKIHQKHRIDILRVKFDWGEKYSPNSGKWVINFELKEIFQLKLISPILFGSYIIQSRSSPWSTSRSISNLESNALSWKVSPWLDFGVVRSQDIWQYAN